MDATPTIGFHATQQIARHTNEESRQSCRWSLGNCSLPLVACNNPSVIVGTQMTVVGRSEVALIDHGPASV